MATYWAMDQLPVVKVTFKETRESDHLKCSRLPGNLTIMEESILCEIMGLSNLIETIKMNIKKTIFFLTNKRYIL